MNVPELRTKKRTNKRTYERKSENYIPVGINAGGIITIKDSNFNAGKIDLETNLVNNGKNLKLIIALLSLEPY